MIKSCVLIRKRMAPSTLSIELVRSTLQLQSIQGPITALWDDMRRLYASQGMEVWDGSYYRLENVQEVADGSNVLHLSTVPYSTVRSLIAYGSKQDLDPQHYPYPIHTESLIVTRDGQYVFGVKKGRGGDFFDLIGGGLQSSEVEVLSGEDIAENMLKEIHEELNLHRNAIRSSEIIGMILAANTSVIIVFHTWTDLSFNELAQIFNERLDSELMDIVGVPAEDLSIFLQGGKGYLPTLDQLLFEAAETL